MDKLHLLQMSLVGVALRTVRGAACSPLLSAVPSLRVVSPQVSSVEMENISLHTASMRRVITFYNKLVEYEHNKIVETEAMITEMMPMIVRGHGAAGAPALSHCV